jgi:hypothetical protein
MRLSTRIDIRQALGLAEDDDSRDAEIDSMTTDRQFELYCQWNGLLGGWAYQLITVIDDLRGSK